MNKKIFKLSSNILMLANLMLAIWIALIACGVLLVLKFNNSGIFLLCSFMLFYIATIIFNIKSVNRLKKIEINNPIFLKVVKKIFVSMKWFIFPILLVISVQKLRTKVWDFYVKNEIMGIKKKVDILIRNLEILDELHDDQFINYYYYEKTKKRLKEALKIEQNKNNQKQKR